FMGYLHSNAFQVIPLRDVAKYVDPNRTPADAFEIIEGRKQDRTEVLVEGEIVDDADGKPLPARLYIRGADGVWHFPKSVSALGSAIHYERRNWINTNALEMHTTLSAHAFRVELLPGRYTFTAEHGKEYFPATREVVVERGVPKLVLRPRR